MNSLLRSMRFPFLILTPVSIFLGYTTSLSHVENISHFDLWLVLAGALLAHISVNTFNEYYDFRSGLDFKTVKTPFSGGSGALIESPDAADHILYTAVISLAVTILIGFYFTVNLGLGRFIFP